MLVTNITWDISDGEYDEDELDDYLELPTEVKVPTGIAPDDVADWLSDEYGFCVRSFSLLDEE